MIRSSPPERDRDDPEKEKSQNATARSLVISQQLARAPMPRAREDETHESAT
jgi:hypothetical protein